MTQPIDLTADIVATLAAEARAEREARDAARQKRIDDFRVFYETTFALLGVEPRWTGPGTKDQNCMFTVDRAHGSEIDALVHVFIHREDNSRGDFDLHLTTRGQIAIDERYLVNNAINSRYIGYNAIELARYVTRSIEGLDPRGPTKQIRIWRAKQIGERGCRFSGRHEGLAAAVLELLAENPNPDADELEALARPFFVF